MSNNYDISMSLEDSLEIDTIIRESSIAADNLQVTSNNDYSLDEIEEHTVIFNPNEGGIHTIDVNGQELKIKVIKPSNLGLYLDDFQDSKFSNRDSYSETGLKPANLEPDNSKYTDPSRINWDLDDSGGLSIDTGNLKLSDSTDYVMHSDISIGGSSWDTKTVWEFQVTRNNQNSNNGADEYVLAMDGTSYKNKDNGNNDTHFTSNRYYMFLNDGGRNQVSLRYNNNEIVAGDTFSTGDTQKFKIIRYSDNTWKLVQNGVSKGTEKNNELTNISNIGISGDSRAKIDVDYFLVY